MRMQKNFAFKKRSFWLFVGKTDTNTSPQIIFVIVPQMSIFSKVHCTTFGAEYWGKLVLEFSFLWLSVSHFKFFMVF
jgi:hypothetical protein